MQNWNDPGLRNFGTTASIEPEDLPLGLPEIPIPSHVADAWDNCEELDRSLSWLSLQPSPIYYGPTSFPLTIHCLLFSSCEDCCFVEWRGPDLFAPLTCSEDVFAFLHSTLPGEVSWLNTRLSITSRLSGQTVVDLPFTISPSEWCADSLSSFQLRVYDVLLHWVSNWCQCRCTSLDQFVLQLAIWPWQDRQRGGEIEHMEGKLAETSLLDPGYFVHNIISNF
ncbi:unnamed protein product [Penicillium camemberti]|uniref:Str. FM013 n=1 Tax=Penicillium camemberti (strain FM 013) TaxID=1429867 RepID=A0A0G4PWW2_PENC3|nr:unnamed protein product [Penicillium camemberti]